MATWYAAAGAWISVIIVHVLGLDTDVAISFALGFTMSTVYSAITRL